MYSASPARYDTMPYRACGQSGLKLPSITLGLWHNFGDATPMETQRDMLRTAFDLGITHFDLANNYGPPYGSAETNFGEHLRRDFRPYRDELIISSKAGWDMWPGPYGSGRWLAQIPARQPGPEPEAHGAGLCGHLLLPPFRPRHPAGRNLRRAGHGGAAGQGLVCGHLQLFGRQNARSRCLVAPNGRSAAHSPAVLQPAQPLGGGGVARHVAGRRRGLHCVQPIGAGFADR